jgi:anti-sigma factor RsiW
MRHYDEEELILYRYGESDKREEIERHLAACGRCRSEFEALCEVFAAADELRIPQRSENYPRDVWRRVQAALPRRYRWLSWPRLSLAAAAAMLLMAAFIAGHWRGSAVAGAEPIPEAARNRVLLAAVGDHLERSERALIELLNAGDDGEVDLTGQRERAAELAADGRLYRRAAGERGEKTIAALLEELERLLVEIANSPEKISDEDWKGLRRRIEGRGLLLKIDIIEKDAKERGGFKATPLGADHV